MFLSIPLGDLTVFALLVTGGIAMRKRGATHKRLMLLAAIALLPPAIARLPQIAAAGPLAFFGLTDLFVVATLLYDRLVRGRVHPASWSGAAVLILSQPASLIIASTGAWMAFATWLTS